MGVEKLISMNAGDGETSYSNNSLLQKTVISKARPVLEDTLKDYLHCNTLESCFKVADLGCSSGSNSLSVITDIIKIVHDYLLTQEVDRKPSLQFQVFLNDLPDNDFNDIFKKLPAYYDSLKKEIGVDFGDCFISGTPGSFYKNIFPRGSIHFFHSSYSLHWLSQVPEGMENNKGNMYIAKSSPLNVFKAYKEQFERDFSSFLRLRSHELVFGGRMVLTFIGRSKEDPTVKDCGYLWELLSRSILDLVHEGLITDTLLDSFNIPHYSPYKDEVKKLVEKEGSFNLEKLEIFEVNWDPEDDINNKNFVFNKYRSGQRVSKYIRAVIEPTLANHFGERKTIIMEKLFERFAMYVGDHLCIEKTKHVNIVMSLTKSKII